MSQSHHPAPGVVLPAILSRATSFPYIVKVGVLAICYFAAAKASLLFAIPPGYATAVWPPAGIALAALLLQGVRIWPGIWLGAMLANFSINQSLSVAAAIATGNALEAVCAAMLVNRLIESPLEFRQLHVVFRFALIAAASSLVAATSGVGALFASGTLPGADFLDNWYTWWQGDTTAIIVVTPLLLAWLREPHREAPLPRNEVIVFGALLALAFVAVFVIAGWTRPGIAHALPFLLIPFMAWAGCRFDERMVTAAVFAVTILAIWVTVNNHGPFASADLNESLLSLQAFTSTVTLMSLVLCAFTRERVRAAALQQSHDLLEQLPLGVWVMDREGKIIQGNPAGKKIWAGARRVDFKQHSEYKGWWAGTDRLLQPHEWAAARAIERGETSIKELLDIECLDGGRKTILNSAMPLRDSAGRISGAIIINEDVTDRQQTKEALTVIAAGVSAATGAEYFRLLLEQVTRALAADGAIMHELTGKKEGEVRTVAAIMDGKWIDNFTYDCRGTPCALALAGNTVVHSDDARSGFAHTPVLGLFAADSCLGIGLSDTDGAVLGVLMVINRKPFQNPDLAKSIMRIVASRAAAELIRKRNEETIRSLAIRLQELIEEERTRIAREVHDELGQALTGLKMDLSWLSKSVERRDSKMKAQIKSMTEFIDSLVHTVRRISTDLRPGELDDLGLVAAIESQAQEFESRTGIRCRLSLPEGDLPLDPRLATAVFRICQELLTNVARHSGATKVSLDLEFSDAWLSLAVHDDGRGIRAAEASNRNAIGLAGIRERAKMFGGNVTIKGSPGKGTLAQIQIPMGRSQNAADGGADVVAA